MSLNAAIPPWAFRFGTGLPLAALELAPASRDVLVYGVLDDALAATLERDRVTLKRTTALGDTLRALATSSFDGILITPSPLDGTALLKALKLGASMEGVDAGELRAAAQRQRVTPVFMMPLPPDDEYAVIVIAPGVAFLERADHVSVHEAITRYDFGRLPEVKGRGALKTATD